MPSGWGELLESRQPDPIISVSTTLLADPGCRVGSEDPKSESKLVQTGRCPWLEGLQGQSFASITPSPSLAQPSSLPGTSPRCKREAYEVEATSTWSIESIVESIVVVPMKEGQADVGWAVPCFPEHQRGHVAPELEGSFHGQAHLMLRQVGRPVHHPVGQVPFVPPPTCKRDNFSMMTGTWACSSTPGLLVRKRASQSWEKPWLSQAEAESPSAALAACTGSRT